MSKKLTNIQRIGLLLTGILAAVVIILIGRSECSECSENSETSENSENSESSEFSEREPQAPQAPQAPPAARDFLGEEF